MVGLSQHPDEHRPERPVLLAVDQQLGEAEPGLPSSLEDRIASTATAALTYATCVPTLVASTSGGQRQGGGVCPSRGTARTSPT